MCLYVVCSTFLYLSFTKTTHVKQLITLLTMVFCTLHNASANTNWTASRSTNQVFIENKGQFDVRHPDLQGKGIQYAIDGGSTMVYFTPSGVTYHLNNYEKNKDRKKGLYPGYASKDKLGVDISSWVEKLMEMLKAGLRR